MMSPLQWLMIAPAFAATMLNYISPINTRLERLTSRSRRALQARHSTPMSSFQISG